jgi:hypothetical protein
MYAWWHGELLRLQNILKFIHNVPPTVVSFSTTNQSADKVWCLKHFIKYPQKKSPQYK